MTEPAQADSDAESDAGSEPPPRPIETTARASVDVRSGALAVLAVVAAGFALHAASEVLIPVLLGLTLSYALSPLVDRMERLRLPRALGAALLLTALCGISGWTAFSLRADATELIESLPEATQKVRQAVRSYRGQSESTIDKLQRAAAQLEQAAQEGAAPAPSAGRGVTRVTIERSRFDIKDYLWTGTLGVVASMAQGVAMVFVAFFLLSAGSSFRRKLVRIAGPSFAERRITVQMLDEISEQIHRYLLVQILISVLVGVVTGLVFWAIGLDHAVVWGVVAFALNFIPYLGSVVVAAGAGLVAFVQFGSIDVVMLVAGLVLVIHLISGNLLTPWLTSRTSRLNAVAVFIGVLGFGALWGIWGLVLGVPILTTVKAVCDRVENLKPVGELLGP
jgi:predicted PurR-regulated permease PerM